jgi:predicted alpha/beta-hydrolase family hydrolase
MLPQYKVREVTGWGGTLAVTGLCTGKPACSTCDIPHGADASLFILTVPSLQTASTTSLSSIHPSLHALYSSVPRSHGSYKQARRQGKLPPPCILKIVTNSRDAVSVIQFSKRLKSILCGHSAVARRRSVMGSSNVECPTDAMRCCGQHGFPVS